MAPTHVIDIFVNHQGVVYTSVCFDIKRFLENYQLKMSQKTFSVVRLVLEIINILLIPINYMNKHISVFLNH